MNELPVGFFMDFHFKKRGITMISRECGWCKEKGIVTVIGCYDNNGNQNDCSSCKIKHCPSPTAEVSHGICSYCLKDYMENKYQENILEGLS